ncbi:hypothetical protein CDN99_21750 [Roseateles aquatilis]|uniref:Uncharacterized protein n=1 Tax=Roseateles aquatilis TaxID=431061 RepID=A0A246J0I8_9BURK|nr:hypothetical protein [Roseateles aquatilis]OWQ85704.1 hypothetical protein CDN99_21750 [Roseateles aquatilis]
MRTLPLLLAALLTGASAFAQTPPQAPSQPQPQGETLLVAPPAGYKVVTQKTAGNMTITEFIPKNEELPAWTEMVTIQVFAKLDNATPKQFQELMGAAWKRQCKTSQSFPVSDGVERGYATSVWFQGCEHKGTPSKDELTWFKAIKGADAFYLVQKAFAYQPTPEQMAPWIEYLRAVRVCDNRNPERACK